MLTVAGSRPPRCQLRQSRTREIMSYIEYILHIFFLLGRTFLLSNIEHHVVTSRLDLDARGVCHHTSRSDSVVGRLTDNFQVYDSEYKVDAEHWQRLVQP
jgi:hypothetical protein